MAIQVTPPNTPIEPQAAFQFPARRRPALRITIPGANVDSKLPSIWGMPHVYSESELYQQYQFVRRNSIIRQVGEFIEDESIADRTSSVFATRGSTPEPAAEQEVQPELGFFDSRPLTDLSLAPCIRTLYLKGNTYTLAMVVEEVLAGVSLFGAKANKYSHLVRRLEALETPVTTKVAKSAWWESDDENDKEIPPETEQEKIGKAVLKKRLGKHAAKLLVEMEEEGKKLVMVLTSIHTPLEFSCKRLRNNYAHLPPLSDGNYWSATYEKRLERILEWDEAVQCTTLDQVLAQYLPTYNSLAKHLSLEFPTVASLGEMIVDEASQERIVSLAKSIFSTTIAIQQQAQEAFSLTKSLMATYTNSLNSLQYKAKELLWLKNCSEEYQRLRCQVESKQAEGGGNDNHTSREQAILIIYTLQHVVFCLKDLDLEDDKHINTSPSAYLPVFADPDVCRRTGPSSEILTKINNLERSTLFLENYFVQHSVTVPRKFLLPFVLELMNYTRGTKLTHADELLSGWVVWRDMCLSLGGWKEMENRAVDPKAVSQALTAPQSSISRNSTMSTSTTMSSSTTMSKITSKSTTSNGTGAISSRKGSIPESFKHMFSFELIPITPAEELAPRDPSPKNTSPKFLAQAKTLMHKASRMDLRSKNISLPNMNQKTSNSVPGSLPLATPINGLTHLIGPPQKIWPASSIAVSFHGFIAWTMKQMPTKCLEYVPVPEHDRASLNLDENFSLEEVFSFYGSAFEELENSPNSVPGSSVARAYSKKKKLEDEKKLREESEANRIPPNRKLSGPLAWKLRKDSQPPVTFDEMNLQENNSPTEMKSRRFSNLVKRLCRFQLGTPITPPADTPTSIPTSPKHRVPGTPLPLYSPGESSSGGKSPTPSTPENLNPDQINAITICYKYRQRYRNSLRLLCELKTEIKCGFEAEKFMEEYLGHEDGPPSGMSVPAEIKDRESAWRRVGEVSRGKKHAKTAVQSERFVVE